MFIKTLKGHELEALLAVCAMCSVEFGCNRK